MIRLNLYPEQHISKPSLKLYFQSFSEQLSLALSALTSSLVSETHISFVITTQFGTSFHLPYVVHGCPWVVSLISAARLWVSGEPVLLPPKNLCSASEESRLWPVCVRPLVNVESELFQQEEFLRGHVPYSHQSNVAGIRPFDHQQALNLASVIFAIADAR